LLLEYDARRFAPEGFESALRVGKRQARRAADQEIKTDPRAFARRRRAFEGARRERQGPGGPGQALMHLVARDPFLLRPRLRREVEVQQLRSKIQSDVQDQVTQSQRDYYLREQMKAIQRELGEENEQAEIEELRQKIEADPSDPRHLVTVYGVGYRFDSGSSR